MWVSDWVCSQGKGVQEKESLQHVADVCFNVEFEIRNSLQALLFCFNVEIRIRNVLQALLSFRRGFQRSLQLINGCAIATAIASQTLWKTRHTSTRNAQRAFELLVASRDCTRTMHNSRIAYNYKHNCSGLSV